VGRLTALILLALALAPASAQAAPRVHKTDAAATKAVTQFALVAERCRAQWLDYSRCDRYPAPSKGIGVEGWGSHNYTIYARSRQGRRFRIERDGLLLKATCTPRGRGACPRNGRWKPKPMPVPTPPFGEEWLPHERELIKRFEALIAVIEGCRARTGSLAVCQDDPDVQTAARWDELIFPDGRFDLQLDQAAVVATARSGTKYLYEWLSDGTADRGCHVSPGFASPCIDESW
jgi:hypothetical protein